MFFDWRSDEDLLLQPHTSEPDVKARRGVDAGFLLPTTLVDDLATAGLLYT
jgi:hypothetical protein